MKHLESNRILHPNQHGFRHGHSCETQLISLVHDLTFNCDINLQNNLISMDMARRLTPSLTKDFCISYIGMKYGEKFINGLVNS